MLHWIAKPSIELTRDWENIVLSKEVESIGRDLFLIRRIICQVLRSVCLSTRCHHQVLCLSTWIVEVRPPNRPNQIYIRHILWLKFAFAKLLALASSVYSIFQNSKSSLSFLVPIRIQNCAPNFFFAVYIVKWHGLKFDIIRWFSNGCFEMSKTNRFSIFGHTLVKFKKKKIEIK